MTAWVVPITHVNGALTATQLNTIRDNLNWLHGFADNITNSTASDTGTAIQLNIARGLTSDAVLEGRVSGDANPRIRLRAGGGIWFSGDGIDTPESAITYSGHAINLERPVVFAFPFKAFIKNGPLTDADVAGNFGGSSSGMFGIDVTNHRLYFRSGVVWKSVQGV